MICFFTGTGNSEYIAKRLGEEINDERLNLFERIKNQDYSAIHSEQPWIIVAPTYAWRIPRILEIWLRKTALCGSKEIYFVMTCGGNVGNASKYLKALCDEKQLGFQGCFEVVMPENYIAMYPTPGHEEALRIISLADERLQDAIDRIKTKQAFETSEITMKDKMSSGIINDLFYPMMVHAKKFYAQGSCISCGLCTQICPMNNIVLSQGKPIWGKHCTHCMACISRCPKEAIEYGKQSIGMPRYTCPK